MAQQLGSFEKVLRFGEGRRVKRLAEQAVYIGTLEPEFEALSDAELAGKTVEFKQRIENGEPVDELVFEAFAAVREAFKRSMGIRLFDVQQMGGIVLHEGDIAEMKTGEGKTFVAVQPLYLNALTGNSVHLVTVNDYLAKRDPEWTKPVWDALGMRASYIANMMPFDERREAYLADAVYGTNSEFGFDYLRDNMAVTLDGVVQRGHDFAIVDEVDSILIDEARTPLIISGEPETAAQVYYDFARVAKTLEGFAAKPGLPKGSAEASGADFEYDEKHKTTSPMHGAIEAVERMLGIDNLYDPRNGQLANHLNQALKAQALFHRDVDYVVQDGEVKIVDEFTGRIMEGRRWSEGLHQAVEAKEGVRIQEEHQTLATITLQNYFRLYDKLAGMTGTAKTEEYLAQLLTRQGVPHNVLNAKEHAREAEIIKDAGREGAVTIATNMAGRGVDIKIDDRVRELGGLYVLGTERHEARRIDNQLRGRSGRQGDPGATRFYLSGRDDLVRLFAGDRIHGIMERFKLPDDQPMEAGILSRQIENAQKKVEEQNFVMRKNVLKYDDVMNVQRQVIYEQRNDVLHGADLSEEIREEWLPEVISNVVSDYTAAELSEEWELGELVAAMDTVYGTGVTEDELKGLERDAIVQEFLDDALDAYAEREKAIEEVQEGLMRDLERFIVLQTVDIRWREHLENMDYMREGIGLRGLAQKDPLVEYRNEGHTMFQALNGAIREEVVTLIFHAEVTPDDGSAAQLQQQPSPNGGGNGALSYEHESLAGADAILAAGGGTATSTGGFGGGGGSVTTPVAAKPKV